MSNIEFVFILYSFFVQLLKSEKNVFILKVYFEPIKNQNKDSIFVITKTANEMLRTLIKKLVLNIIVYNKKSNQNKYSKFKIQHSNFIISADEMLRTC